MKSPLWPKVVCVLMIMMACVALLGALQLFAMPKMIEAQKQMAPEMKKKFQSQPEQARRYAEAQMDKISEQLNGLPDWFNAWCGTMGVLCILFAGFYVVVGIGLFRLQIESITMFHWLMGLDSAFLIFRAAIGTNLIGWLALSLIVGGCVGVIMNLILWITVAFGDQRAFSEKAVQFDMQKPAA